MGRVLQIRVTAWTYDEDEVTRTWPRLTALVWPESEKWSPPGQRHGVMDLAKALPDAARFGDWPEAVRHALRDGVEETTLLAEKLEAALADWRPSEANALSDRLEEALTALENAIPEA